MAKTLEDIRFIVERNAGGVDNKSIINWCNEVNMDIGTAVNVAAPTYPITLTTTDLEYALPDDLKEINRLWLQREYDSGINREIRAKYRVYNGMIQFQTPFPAIDTLNVDYYKFLDNFTAITDTIEFEDRYVTLYTSYCEMRYYTLPSTQQTLGERTARQNYELASGLYRNTKNQVIQNHGFTTPDLTVRERW